MEAIEIEYPETYEACMAAAEEARVRAGEHLDAFARRAAVKQMTRYRLLVEHANQAWPDQAAADPR
jgi:hypothetical protein